MTLYDSSDDEVAITSGLSSENREFLKQLQQQLDGFQSDSDSGNDSDSSSEEEKYCGVFPDQQANQETKYSGVQQMDEEEEDIDVEEVDLPEDDEELLKVVNQLLQKSFPTEETNEKKYCLSNSNLSETKFASVQELNDDGSAVSTNSNLQYVAGDDSSSSDDDELEENVDAELLENLNHVLSSSTKKGGKKEVKFCGVMNNKMAEEAYCGCSMNPSSFAPIQSDITPDLETKFCGCGSDVAQNLAHYVARLPPQQANEVLYKKTQELTKYPAQSVTKFLEDYVETVSKVLKNGDIEITTKERRCTSPTQCTTFTSSKVISKKDLKYQMDKMSQLQNRMHEDCVLSGDCSAQVYDHTLTGYLLHIKTFLKPFGNDYFKLYCYRILQLIKRFDPNVQDFDFSNDQKCSKMNQYVQSIESSIKLQPFVAKSCSSSSQMDQYQNDHDNKKAHLVDVIAAFRQLSVHNRKKFLEKHHIIGKYEPMIQEFDLKQLKNNSVGPLIQLGYSPWALERSQSDEKPIKAFKLLE